MAQRSVSVYRLVQIALEDGDLVRPDRCEECDASASAPGLPYKILGHHDDYSKPLDVRWICGQCHQKWHKENEPLHPEMREVTETVPDPSGICDVCGHPIKSVPGKVQKKRHKPCRDFKNFLAAAVRSVRQMDPKPTPVAASKIRHEATVASYRIGAMVQPRDARGRFC